MNKRAIFYISYRFTHVTGIYWMCRAKRK